jgi:esterase/lipase
MSSHTKSNNHTESPVPCLLIHGFTGGPFEVEPLADHLRSNGRICRIVELPGHHRDAGNIGSVHWQDWIHTCKFEAERMMKQHGTFDLAGFSMGGLLASYIANRFPVRRLILLSPAVIYFSPGRFVKELAARLVSNDWRHFHKIGSTPLSATRQFTRLAARLRPELSRIQVPVFIAHGEQDAVIHPRSAAYVYRKVKGSKQLYMSSKANHLICLHPDSIQLFNRIDDFLAE